MLFAENFVHDHLDLKGHVVVKMHIDGTFWRKQLANHQQPFTQELHKLCALQQIGVSVLLVARLENTVCRIRRINIDKLHLAANTFII